MAHTDYDKYGNHKNHVLDNIENGDYVEYIISKSHFDGKTKINVKTPLRGFWNDGCVTFDDKEKTTVRTIHWLKLVRKNEIKNSTL